MKRSLAILFGMVLVYLSLGFIMASCISPNHDAVPGRGIIEKMADTLGPGGGAFGILDVLASLCAVGAVGAIVARVFLGEVVPGKLVGTLVVTAIATWTLKLILVKYLWIVALLSVIGLVVMGILAVKGHANWIEKRLGVDIDRDGDVGIDEGDEAYKDHTNPR